MTESTPAPASPAPKSPSPRDLAGRRLAVLLTTGAGERRWREIRAAAERRHRIAGVWRLDRGEGDELRERLRTGIDLVVCESAVEGDRGRGRQMLAAAAGAGVPALDLVGFYTALTGRLPLDLVEPAWLARRLLARSRERRFKRVFDWVAGSVLLVLSVPFQLLIALAVVVDSGRPVLLRQERLRRFKEPFTCYRFRTSAVDADADAETEAGADSRVTRVGRLLRRHHLDELPQLWNVVRGHLSLVGPRPIRDEVRRRLAERQPLSNLRFLHRPGLTGWSRVRGLHGSTDDQRMIELETDLLYLASGRWLDDLYILWRTLWVVVGTATPPPPAAGR